MKPFWEVQCPLHGLHFHYILSNVTSWVDNISISYSIKIVTSWADIMIHDLIWESVTSCWRAAWLPALVSSLFQNSWRAARYTVNPAPSTWDIQRWSNTRISLIRDFALWSSHFEEVGTNNITLDLPPVPWAAAGWAHIPGPHAESLRVRRDGGEGSRGRSEDWCW